jgi:hypothetical protein
LTLILNIGHVITSKTDAISVTECEAETISTNVTISFFVRLTDSRSRYPNKAGGRALLTPVVTSTPGRLLPYWLLNFLLKERQLITTKRNLWNR